MSRLTCRVAAEDWEFDQIARLNHRTFALEIPQHAARPDGVLVDRFHGENTYVVCVHGARVVGMIALLDRRPFSLDQKLEDLDRHLPVQGLRPCEIRLLAVEPDYRNTAVFAQLLATLCSVARGRGCDLALISATTRQLKLYSHLGFEPFGPRVGTADAQYQPMYLTLKRFEASLAATIDKLTGPAPVALLPGPVTVSARVLAAAGIQPASHRSREFLQTFDALREQLRALFRARHVQIMQGSGTTANDAVAAQLARSGLPGVVLVNGEFGRRLADHARRWKLDAAISDGAWGETFTAADIKRILDAHPHARWLWAVHCETSTGVLNDLSAMGAMAAERGLLLCADCISSLGTVDVDLDNVSFATGVSGKALGGLPGLALVFHRDIPAPSADLPLCLDLGFYAEKGGVPFTLCSNLTTALSAALADIGPARYTALRELSAMLWQKLCAAGFEIVAAQTAATPAVVTFALPLPMNAGTFAEGMKIRGFELAHASSYLAARNWVQISLMAIPTSRMLEDLAGAMVSECHAEAARRHAA